MNLSCGDEPELLIREAQYYLVRQPLLEIGKSVTLLMATTGKSQKFTRLYNSGSLQFSPTGACQ